MSSSSAKEPITPDTIARLARFYGAAIQPGGSNLVYILGVMGKGKNAERRYHQIWRLDLESSKSKPEWVFGFQGYVSPYNLAAVPDGEDFSFLCPDRSGNNQLVKMPYRGSGEPSVVLDFETSIRAYAWSPDARRIAFVAYAPESSSAQKEEAAFGWQVPWTALTYPRLWLYDVKTGETSAVIKPLAAIQGGQFSPAAISEQENRVSILSFDEWKHVIATSDRRNVTATSDRPPQDYLASGHDLGLVPYQGSLVWKSTHELIFKAVEKSTTSEYGVFSQIYRINTKSGGGNPLELKIHISGNDDEKNWFSGSSLRQGHLGSLAISPDGTKLAIQSAVDRSDPLNGSLLVTDLNEEGSLLAYNLTKGMDVTVRKRPFWIDDKNLVMLAHEGVWTRLYSWRLLPRPDGSFKATPTRLEWPDELIIDNALDIDPQTLKLAASANTSCRPSEMYTTRLKRRSSKLDLCQRSRHNEPFISGVRLPRQTVVEWESHQQTIQGILVLPTQFDKAATPYPLILGAHGGPEISSKNGWPSNNVAPVAYFAEAGYAMLWPNYRGSSGRGVEFSKLIQNDCGGKEFEDMWQGVEYLLREEPEGLRINPERVGILGWSYGGFLAAWGATRHSERFRAAVVGAAVTDWTSFIGVTDIPSTFAATLWPDFTYQEPEHFEMLCKRSPVQYVARCETPILILQGEDDARVPLSQSKMLHQYLSLRNRDREPIPTQLRLYPGEGHVLRQRSNVIDYFEEARNWFDTHMLPPR